MEDFIAGLHDRLDRGVLTRRRFCETITLAAGFYAVGGAASDAEPAQGFRIIGINHISYACADYRKARDFYASVLGMEAAPHSDNGRQASLMFGPPAGQGGSFLIPRNGRITTNAKARIDHICYTVSNSDEREVRAALTAKGLAPAARDGNLHVYDPFDFEVALAASGSGEDHGAPLKAALVNAISYTCTDVGRTADWYSKIFNLQQIKVREGEVALPFGKPGEQPMGVVAKGVPMPRLMIRTQADRGETAHAAKALVNHIAYMIAGFEKERVRAELKRLGYPNPLQDGEHSFHVVDPNGFDVQISGLQMTALGG